MMLRGMKMSRVNLSKYSKIRLTIDNETHIMRTRYLDISKTIFTRSKTYSVKTNKFPKMPYCLTALLMTFLDESNKKGW